MPIDLTKMAIGYQYYGPQQNPILILIIH